MALDKQESSQISEPSEQLKKAFTERPLERQEM